MSRRVWITGVGAVSAAGAGAAALDALLRSGESGVRKDAGLDGAPAGAAPTIRFARECRHLDRAAALFFTAGCEAWENAGLSASTPVAERLAIIEGSSLGPTAELLTLYQERLTSGEDRPHRPSMLVKLMTGAGGAALAQLLNAHGAVLHLSAGSVSATCAIGEAFQRIASGAADVVVAGGAECPLHPEILAVFRAAGILADAYGADCRPFDVRRRGTVLGEGAGALVLESDEHARGRGAVPRAVVTGFGLKCEAHSMTAPDPTGAGVVAAVRAALPGGVERIGWIKSHGTGTQMNDAAECHGLSSVFGERMRDVPLTSLKPALGHCLGASGAVEAVAALLALEGGYVPATVGLEQLDPELAGGRFATRVLVSDAREVLMVSESFGGRCAALVFERPNAEASAA
jgi:3-oxoacyl-[acyl-carrier-protein] synthase II